jgi:nicotinamidase/pyrazinamidase
MKDKPNCSVYKSINQTQFQARFFKKSLSRNCSLNIFESELLQKNFIVSKKDALLITDIQNDFLDKGALPVPNGNQVIPILNAYAKIFENVNATVIASRDWHPPNHLSFKEQGGPWPPHCVQNTKGAEFHPELKLTRCTVIVSKATHAGKEAYSAFDGTTLAEELKMRGIARFFVGGLATDYCIVNTGLDARKLGYPTIVLMDDVRGIDVNPGDVDRAVEAMINAGAEQAISTDFQEAVDVLSLDELEADALEEKPRARQDSKEKARMRPKGSTRIKTEH